MRKRDNSIVENVDFTRLSEILRKKHIKWSKLSRKCGYDDSGYVRKNVFGRERLNWTVADTLEKVYGISPEQYCYEKEEKSTSNNDTAKTTASDDDTYKFIVSINGEFLKRLAMASLNEHMSIEDFIFDCISKSVN